MKKYVVPFLIVLAFILGFILSYNNKYPVGLGLFSFTDLGDDPAIGLIGIEGTWVSDTKLARPIQTTSIDCWKKYALCIETTAEVTKDRQLILDTTYWDIAGWSKDKILVKDNETALCTNYTLNIDRKNKIVTSVRSTKKPKSRNCEWIQDEPIFMRLSDGYKISYR